MLHHQSFGQKKPRLLLWLLLSLIPLFGAFISFYGIAQLAPRLRYEEEPKTLFLLVMLCLTAVAALNLFAWTPSLLP